MTVPGEDVVEQSVREGTDSSCVATLSMADPASGYAEMVLYARNRLEIRKLVEYMNCRAGREARRPPRGEGKTRNPEDNPNLCVLEQGEDPESQ